jgi:hypothetical protein
MPTGRHVTAGRNVIVDIVQRCRDVRSRTTLVTPCASSIIPDKRRITILCHKAWRIPWSHELGWPATGGTVGSATLHFTRTNMIGPLVHANASVLIFTAQPYATNAIPLDAKLFQVPC